MTVDTAMRHMEAISDSIMTVEQLADVFMTCARHDLRPTPVAGEQALSELRGVLDPDLMPTAKDFAAVYLATGRSESDRLSRWGTAPHYVPSGVTESAWCRSSLKRAALLQEIEGMKS